MDKMPGLQDFDFSYDAGETWPDEGPLMFGRVQVRCQKEPIHHATIARKRWNNTSDDYIGQGGGGSFKSLALPLHPVIALELNVEFVSI
jgi:hypothetical protein